MEASNDKIFLKGKFKVDSHKNLYRLKQDEYVLVIKLKKDAYSILEDGSCHYLFDTFGNCFLIEEESVSFCFGILSNPLFCCIKSNLIYILDKYSRVFIYSKNELKNIKFLIERVHGMKEIKTLKHQGVDGLGIISNCAFMYETDGKPNEITYEKTNTERQNSLKYENECSFKICDIEFQTIQTLEYDAITKRDENEIHYLKDNKEYSLEFNSELS